MTERFRLDGQVAVVVGGTGALGGAMARGLAAAGAAVAVAGRDEGRGGRVAADIEAAGGRAAFTPCDAGSRERLAEARELVLERLGEPAVLVNAAGGNQPAVTLDEQLRFEDVDPQAWRDDALCRTESRARFRTLLHGGYVEAFRTLHPHRRAYTFWDYQAGRWQRGEGLRIDHLLLSPEAADRLEACEIDSGPRGGVKASDHTPIWCTLRE